MFGSHLFIGTVALVSVSSSALASITVCDSRLTFAIWASMHNDAAVIREDFSTVVAGATADSFTGKVGSEANWVASAVGGLQTQGDSLRALQSGRAISVAFDSGRVYGVGADYFFRTAAGAPISGIVLLSLSDGTQFARTVTNTDTFAGFWSDGAAITRITITPVGPSANFNLLGMDNMDIGFVPVPTPGAIALISLAGLTAGRRRRG